MGKTVENGKLLRVSPSCINAFDSTTSFGCERRWWFKYVKGLEEPTTGNQKLGTELHAIIENHLKGMLEEVGDSQAAGLFLHGVAMVEDIRLRGIKEIEAEVNSSIAGVPLIGYCDVVTETGIVDWKTTSDFRRYAKTPEQLQKDTQMLLYARHFHPDRPLVALSHGYFQTKGRHVEEVATEISKRDLDAHVENIIIPLVEKMKVAAALDSHEKLPKSPEKCSRCPFRSACEKEAIMGFFSKMKQATPVVETTPAPVVPPDAPPQVEAKRDTQPMPTPEANNPEQKFAPPPVPQPAPAPVPQAPVPAPRRGPGRPPGSKNKPKFEVPQPPTMSTQAATPVIQVRDTGVFEVTEITVTEGITINLGNYNSARCDVTLKARVGSLTPEQAHEALTAKIRELLERQASQYEAAAGK